MKISTLFFVAAGVIGAAEIYSGTASNEGGTDSIANFADSLTTSVEAINPSGIPVYVYLLGVGLILAFMTPQFNKSVGGAVHIK